MVHAHAHRDHVANLQARDVTVVYVTLSADFDGPIGGYVTMSQTSSEKNNKATAGLGAPVQQTREETQVKATGTASENTDSQTTTRQKAGQTTHGSQTVSTEQSQESTTQTTFITSSSSSTPAIAGLEGAAATASSSGISAASASPTAASVSQGLAGAIGAIAVFILLWIRKKKQGQQHLQAVESENEKYPESVTWSSPPQLNIQFASDGGATGLSAGGTLAPIAASATPQSSSHGSNPFGDPVNPFSNPGEAPSPLASSTALSPAPASEDTGDLAPVANTAVTGIAAAAAVTQEKELPESPEDSSTSSQAFPPKAAPNEDTTAPAPITPTATATAVPVLHPPVSGPGPAPANVHRVQMDFNPSMEDELELHFGQLVRLLHEYDDGWALCTRLDRSQQGVVPRSCLSSRPLKPRPPPGPGVRGPPPMAAPDRPMPPRPTTPSSNFHPHAAQPQSPARPMSPGRPSHAGTMPLRLQNGRPLSPAQTPPALRSFSPGPGPRPMVPRSMSPGPYGLPGMQRPYMPASERPRSNSTGAAMGPNPRQGGTAARSPLGGPIMPPVSTIPRATPTVVESPISDHENREW
ncbi:SH3 domain protein [Aspergillus saccharolyticus JOP 1030-1]|uniref:SH3 domain-containing protein n=1 Tax=Aspergillus saccharolyticus JOP 1030-1 TaxID=1450539 RepID=A0A318ZW91_9EURO|nr:hypothetical protein BP01DRAFT_413506 [Aspergillus saccharolyticus JOP 1030-1]PYH48360.1 hypothetical protein BP01DRAFT_413506 [Aspergillus saccharolyticus JOP 1030-1]